MPRWVFILLAAGAAALCVPFLASAQSWPGAQGPYDRWGGGPDRDPADSWKDDAHRRDRIDAVRGHPDFAEEEARIRSDLDAGLAQGWLDRDDFLIFGRQLHQTEIHEAREMRIHGYTLPRAEHELIRANLKELRHQLDESRRERREIGMR
jgi:hypothetical protein